MKILRVGDPHVKPGNIDESERIMEMVLFLAGRHNVDRIEILGDLFHTHAIIRLEVLEFWYRWLERFSQYETVVLVGNHDMTGDYSSSSHALSVFEQDLVPRDHGLTVISRPIVKGLYGYLPYQHSIESYLQNARFLASSGAKILVCHQTIGGAQYENGFYAPDAVDPADIPFDLIFSGHIHKQQIIKAGDKTIIYPGTSRWDTASDANESKGLWIYEHDNQTGKLISSEFFSTSKICKPIVSVTWFEGESQPVMPHPDDARISIELIGSSDWISKQRSLMRGKMSIKAKITDSKSSGRKAGENLQSFIEKFFQTQMDRQKLLAFMKEEGLV